MGYTDEMMAELAEYMPALTKREDFDQFWSETKACAGKIPLQPVRIEYNYPGVHVKVYDITYNGFDGTPIHGWYLVPDFGDGRKVPCLVHYHGFGGDRGMPSDFMQWIMAGVAVVSVDCRQQCGATGNRADYSSGSALSVVCYGILNKYEYYYRAVYMDCIRAIDFAVSQPEVDGSKIIIAGGSQGGALGMAVSALDDRPCLALVDVPSNSNIDKRVEGYNGSFSAVADYLKTYPDRVDQAFETLSYFDTMNMADQIHCPVFASVGLKDTVCPAKLYFATYNRITGKKEIRLYPFNGHEGGGRVHNELKLRVLRSFLSTGSWEM